MNKREIIKKIEMKKEILKRYGVKKIGIFGSFAKGKQHKKSDVDILVTFDKIEFDDYMDLISFLERIFKRKVDLVIEKNLFPELKYVKNEAEYVRL
ncbi:MAG TPA: nucleotidyltransferase family protein [Candidatus Nanoarchaeia archaeon]|nr:nucleotidyltransferase family protein [Candidatus Nanoarchaeia archaeon]